VQKDFYAERPIKIRLTGSFHQFGAFVSGIAALPRIVTLHDVDIVPVTGSASYDNLQMELTAKTYRYLDDEEVAAGSRAAQVCTTEPCWRQCRRGWLFRRKA
jgi:type IV pilus assembly protein PilO